MQVVFMVQFSESFQHSMLFPFVPFMVADFAEIAAQDVGFYVGLLVASFSLGQLISSYPWGYITQRAGIKVGVLAALSCSGLLTLVFGFSTCFLMAFLSRLAAGLTNSVMGCVKTFIGRITDESNQSRAMALMSAASTLGGVLGPALGGILSQPALLWPNAVHPGSILARFPYLLPCAITTAVMLASFVFAWLVMEEPEMILAKASAERAKQSLLASSIAAASECAEADTTESLLAPSKTPHWATSCSTKTTVSGDYELVSLAPATTLAYPPLSTRRRTSAAHLSNLELLPQDLPPSYSASRLVPLANESQALGVRSTLATPSCVPQLPSASPSSASAPNSASSGSPTDDHASSTSSVSRSPVTPSPEGIIPPKFDTSPFFADRDNSVMWSEDHLAEFKRVCVVQEPSGGARNETASTVRRRQSVSAGPALVTELRDHAYTRVNTDELDVPAASQPWSCATGLRAKIHSARWIVVFCTSMYGYLAMCFVMLDDTYPVFCREPVSSGGLGWTTTQIGTMSSITAGCSILYNIFFYPAMARRLGLMVRTERRLKNRNSF